MSKRLLPLSLCLASSLAAQQSIEGEARAIPGEATLPTTSSLTPSGGSGVIVPASLASSFGTSDNAIPWSWTPSHYQQCFLATEFPNATQIIQCIAFRGRRNDTGAKVDAEMWLGYTSYDETTLTTTYASNVKGTLTNVLKRKSIIVPDMGATNTDPKFFIFQIPLDQAFVYTKATGNLLVEIKVHGNSNNNASFAHYLNAGSGTGITTSRIYSSGDANATTGSKTTNYGLVMCFDTKCKTTGIADRFGTGCPGSGGFAGQVLPAYYATAWGESNNYYPHGATNMRYQQIFLGSEIGKAVSINSVNLRQDDLTAGRTGGTQTYQITLGQSTYDNGNIGFDFDAHFDVSGQKKVVLSGNVNLPNLTGLNTDLQKFAVNIPFTSNFQWLPVADRNLLIEWVNTSTAAVTTYLDCTSNFAKSTTARIWATSATATKATGGTRNYGLVMGFGVAGAVGNAVPVADTASRPVINTTYEVTLSAAAPSSGAVFINGLSDSKWLGLNLPLPMAFLGAPNCNLLVSGDLLAPLATDAQGNASVKLPLPNDPNLVNVNLFHQFLVIDAKTSAGIAMSNGVKALIGEQ